MKTNQQNVTQKQIAEALNMKQGTVCSALHGKANANTQKKVSDMAKAMGYKMPRIMKQEIQLRILEMVRRGVAPKEIANVLNCHVNTVYGHIRSCNAKADIKPVTTGVVAPKQIVKAQKAEVKTEHAHAAKKAKTYAKNTNLTLIKGGNANVKEKGPEQKIKLTASEVQLLAFLQEGRSLVHLMGNYCNRAQNILSASIASRQVPSVPTATQPYAN